MLWFALPIFLGNVFQQFYNAFDSWVVGRFLGDKALAAVASSGNLIFMMTGFFMGVAMGAGVIIAQCYGARDYDTMNRAIHTNLIFGVVAGGVLTVVGVWFTPTILQWMGTPEDVLPESVTYFRFYFCGAVFNVMYNVFVGILHGVGDSKHPLYYLMISTVINIILDLLFVGWFGWGVGSAAVATVISQGVSAALCCVHLCRVKDAPYQLQIKKIKADLESLRGIVRYGLPSGVQNSVIALANVVVQSSINSFGAGAMAGCGTYSKIEGFAFLPVTCFTMALSTFVGQNLGAGQQHRVKKGIAFGVICSVVIAELIGIASYLFAPGLIRFFNDSPEVVDFGVRHMRTISLFYCLLALSHCMAGVMRGAGKASVPMYTMLLCWCVIRVSYITFMLPRFPRLETVSWAYPLTWTLSSIIFLVYFAKGNWMNGFRKQQEERIV